MEPDIESKILIHSLIWVSNPNLKPDLDILGQINLVAVVVYAQDGSRLDPFHVVREAAKKFFLVARPLRGVGLRWRLYMP